MSAASQNPFLTILETLGEGSFGKVYKALYHEQNKIVAVKVIPLADDMGEIAQEIEMLRQCDSKHIVQYFGSFSYDEQLWIIMEYCAGSSLLDVMEANGRCLTELQLCGVLAGACDGLLYLHQRRKIHRDVKAGNLLLGADGEVKLADFGVAAQLGAGASRRRTVIGTPFWMAPEVITCQRGPSRGGPAGYDERADVWSLGITAIELAEGQAPHSGVNPLTAIFLIPTLPPPKLKHPEEWSPRLHSFLQRCLVKEPSARSTTAELASDPLVQSGRDKRALGSLRELMALSREPLRAYRAAHQAEAGGGEAREGVAGTMVVKAEGDGSASPAASGTTVLRGGTMVVRDEAAEEPPQCVPQRSPSAAIDAKAIRSLASLLVLQGASPEVFAESSAPVAASSGTMVVKEDAPPPSGTMVVRQDEGGTMVIKEAPGVQLRRGSQGAKPNEGTMLLKQSDGDEASDVVPAFLRQHEHAPISHAPSSRCSSSPPFLQQTSVTGSSTTTAGLSSSTANLETWRSAADTRDGARHADRGLASPPTCPGAVSQTSSSCTLLGDSVGGRARQLGEKRCGSRLDVAHMGIDTLDRELAGLAADLERDIGKVYRKYERIERVLRSARDKKIVERDRAVLHGGISIGLGEMLGFKK
ncbi:hypothetical protein AB1Y20_007205 [Prymnesium parvum]|uniref:non-specific serine/threonine protein kinase n=1 Tax=Prymnesium parvum TaxID=97485 RepID=A0AB34ITU9_PRYPA